MGTVAKYLVLLAILGISPGHAGESVIAVIVHPQREEAFTREDVAQIYLKRRRFWGDGRPIIPLNLPADSPLRTGFSQAILGPRHEQLAEYWNRQYFSGLLPPATLASTEAITRYVASDRDAVGYLPKAEVSDAVRIVLEITPP